MHTADPGSVWAFSGFNYKREPCLRCFMCIISFSFQKSLVNQVINPFYPNKEIDA